MKRIFCSIVAVLAGLSLANAQNFKLETKEDGKEINNGDTITVVGVVDFENHYDLPLGLIFTNTSDETLYIASSFDTVGLPENVKIQFCARVCYVDIMKIPVQSIEPNGFLGRNEDVHVACIPNEAYDEAVVGCTFTDTVAHESLSFIIRFKPRAEDPGVANENTELAGVSVYPNPSHGMFNLNVPERAQVEIFAVNGQMIRQMEVMAGKTAVEINRAGVYFLRVRAGGKTAVKRVVIG